MCRAFSVSPTYCMLHLLQLIMYTMFFVLHVNWPLMVYFLPVVLLVKELVQFISWQVLHRLLPHGALSPGVGGGGLGFLSLLGLGDFTDWVVSCRLPGVGLVWLF